jgi:hypothetical protein
MIGVTFLKTDLPRIFEDISGAVRRVGTGDYWFCIWLTISCMPSTGAPSSSAILYILSVSGSSDQVNPAQG